MNFVYIYFFTVRYYFRYFSEFAATNAIRSNANTANNPGPQSLAGNKKKARKASALMRQRTPSNASKGKTQANGNLQSINNNPLVHGLADGLELGTSGLVTMKDGSLTPPRELPNIVNTTGQSNTTTSSSGGDSGSTGSNVLLAASEQLVRERNNELRQLYKEKQT